MENTIYDIFCKFKLNENPMEIKPTRTKTCMQIMDNLLQNLHLGNQTQFQPTKIQKNHLKTHWQKHVKG